MVVSLRGVFAAPTPALPHGGGGRTATWCIFVLVFTSGMVLLEMPSVTGVTPALPYGGEGRTVVYIRLSARGVCKWKCRFAAYLLPPTPALPHVGGGRTVTWCIFVLVFTSGMVLLEMPSVPGVTPPQPSLMGEGAERRFLWRYSVPLLRATHQPTPRTLRMLSAPSFLRRAWMR